MAGNRGDELVVAGMRPQSFLGASNPYAPVHRGTTLILFIDSLILLIAINFLTNTKMSAIVGVIMGSKSDWPTMKSATDMLDEFGIMRNPESVWGEVIRPALSDQQGWAVFISSPKGRNYFYDLYNNAKTSDNWNSWQFKTIDGGYVPQHEIEYAKNDLDERTFRQEYEASFESYDGLVVPNYDRELNASYEVIKEDDTLIFGIDFNVNKMPCTVNVLRGDTLHCVDFFFGNFNTSELMEAIQLRYPKHRKIFHTDASGTANKSSAGGATDITIIRNYGYQVMNLARNPNIIDRVNAFNSMVLAVSGVRKFFVNPKLKRVVETLEKHFFDENGLPNKKHEYHDDVFDALSYPAFHYSDYSKHQMVRMNMSGH